MLKHAVVLTGLLTVSVQAATVLVDNLAEPTRATTIVDVNLWAAQSFITDGNSYSLVNIMTVLGDAVSAPPVVAELRKDTITGSLLTTFAVPALAGPLSVKTLTPDTPVALDANTIYWLILEVPDVGSFGWSYAEGNNFVGPGELSAYGYSRNQGATWGEINAADPYKLRVNVDSTVIPEPSTLAAGVTALLAAMLLRLRRRSA